MTYRAAPNAVVILRWWLTAVGVATLLLIGILIGVLRLPLLPIGSGAVILVAIWVTQYPKHYIRRLRVWIDDDTVSVQRGVGWRRHTAVPRSALRTVELIQTPLQRKYNCVHLVLRFAGGMTVLPFLSLEDAGFIGDRLA